LFTPVTSTTIKNLNAAITKAKHGKNITLLFPWSASHGNSKYIDNTGKTGEQE